MNKLNVEQGSDEWLVARLGKVTASRMADVMATRKDGKAAAARADYLHELVCEVLSGLPQPSYVSAAMRWGIEHEPEAKRLYAFDRDVELEGGGFVLHERIAFFGASPDSFVSTVDGELGLAEFKCPETRTHLHTLRSGAIDGGYFLQMQAQMAVTGLPWCDFVSFDPRLPRPLQLHVQRLGRDEATIDAIEASVEGMLSDLWEVLSDLERRFGVTVPR